MTKAASIAEKFTGDPKGLPQHVQDAIVDVEATVKNLDRRVKLAEALHGQDPDHPLALEPGNHPQTTAAYRFEDVDGEIVEIRKETAGGKVKLIYRPDLTPGEKVDPAAALEAMLSGDSIERE
jgi:hypothetical protein